MSDDATPAAGSETFAEFKDSFSYGSRNNLDAKFLVNLDEADASAFFEELIEQASEVADGTDDQARAMATFFMRWPSMKGPFLRDRGMSRLPTSCRACGR